MANLKLREAHEQFKDFLKSQNKSNSTIVAYAKDIDQLISFLETLKKNLVHEVNKEDIEGYVVYMSKNGLNIKSQSRKLNSTRTFYRFLKSKGHITEDPSILVEHPKYDLGQPRVLTPTEYRALRDATRKDVRVYAIIEILLQTGIRIAELAELRLSDVLPNELIINAVGKHEQRRVPLNKAAKEALNNYLKKRPEIKDDHVFVTKTGRPFLIRNIRTSVERFFRMAEIKNATINDLRNTFIAHHLKHGVTLATLSKLVGHKRLSTTERYLKYIQDREKETDHLTEL